ncbi:hypothetical protein E2C01_009281 [Portunus trituberculatus]|uniref:Uncharacterized protein n=1 Tax=Portunus trituberculatus TaxID=210409 RepID=A0A5B7D325_PORTR|nr:hypothetical protein [Portunus trituberculatus]
MSCQNERRGRSKKHVMRWRLRQGGGCRWGWEAEEEGRVWMGSAAEVSLGGKCRGETQRVQESRGHPLHEPHTTTTISSSSTTTTTTTTTTSSQSTQPI